MLHSNPSLSLRKDSSVALDALTYWHLLEQLTKFTYHEDIEGKLLATNVSVSTTTTYQYEINSKSRELTLNTHMNQTCMIQFPSKRQINGIIMDSKKTDIDCLKQIIQLLEEPLHFYLSAYVDSIPIFLTATYNHSKKNLPSKLFDKDDAYKIFREDATSCLSFLLKDFLPQPISILLALPELRTLLNPEIAQLLNQIANALGIAIIRFMDDTYTHAQDSLNNHSLSKLDFIKNLIDKGANVNVIKLSTEYRSFQTPLSAAYHCKENSILELLVKHGADANTSRLKPEEILDIIMMTYPSENHNRMSSLVIPN